MKEKLFRYLVKHAVNPTPSCGIPLSARFIAEQLKTTYKECIKHLHTLKDNNLVEVVRGGYYDDYYGKNFLYCGWYITKQAEETKIYREELVKMSEIIDKEMQKYKEQL